MSTAVVLVEDHRLVATALALALRDEGAAVRYFPGPCAELDRTIDEDGPGVVLLDLELEPGPDGRAGDGVALVHRMSRCGWSVLVLSATTDEHRLVDAVAEGAVGWVSKGRPLDELLDAYRAVVRGDHVLDVERRRELLADRRAALRSRDVDRRRLERLTSREREVLGLLAAGLRAREIAVEAHVSLATVRTQVKAVRTKLGVSSQLEAVALHHRAYGASPRVGTAGSPAPGDELPDVER